MATTPNFNWSTPDNTGLVKNGALDIRTLGDSIDASLVDLKGGTTGQVLAKASGTDMDFTWTTSSAGMTNPMTTTGDTIYSSSGSTPARLGIGSTGQVLTVAGGVPSWATPSSGSSFVGCYLTGTSSQTIATGTSTIVSFDAEVLDTNTFHNTATNNSRITIPSGKAGVYLISGFAYSDNSNTTGFRAVGLKKNGSAIAEFNATPYFSTANDLGTQFSTLLNLSVADYIEMYFYQSSGSNRTLYKAASGNNATFLQAIYLGA